MDKDKTEKIILSGGGTGGSVIPLLNLLPGLREIGDLELLFVGGRQGVEREMVKKESLRYKGIFSGKLRRYVSWKNFVDPFLVMLGFLQSLLIVIKEKPDLVISAGSFVSVPLVWAARAFGVPVLLIQLDVRPGLANKLMAKAASRVAVVFERSLNAYGKKAVWTGAPFSIKKYEKRSTKKDLFEKYELNNKLPLVLIMGGGTGAVSINKLVKDTVKELSEICNIIHLAGKNKEVDVKSDNYRQFGFLPHEEVMEIMKVCDLVVSRAGLGTITELAILGKPAIIIPMPNTHQEDNALMLINADAAVVLREDGSIRRGLVENIKEIVSKKETKNDLERRMSGFMKKEGKKNILKIIKNIFK